MKKYTQEEFDNFKIVDGKKQCPTGDYTAIKVFGEWCSFGESCRFFSRKIKRNGLIQVVGIGSTRRTTQIFLLTDNTVLISCGCQQGITLDVFKQRIRYTHAEGTKYRKQYEAVLMLIDAEIEGED